MGSFTKNLKSMVSKKGYAVCCTTTYLTLVVHTALPLLKKKTGFLEKSHSWLTGLAPQLRFCPTPLGEASLSLPLHVTQLFFFINPTWRGFCKRMLTESCLRISLATPNPLAPWPTRCWSPRCSWYRLVSRILPACFWAYPMPGANGKSAPTETWPCCRTLPGRDGGWMI